MHGQQNIKFGNAKQAKSAHQYKNIKQSCTRLMRQSCTIRHANTSVAKIQQFFS